MRKYALWKKLRSWEEKYLWLTLSSVQYEVTGKEDRKLQYSEKTRKSMCLEIMGMQWMRISGYALAESFSALITLGVISIIMFLVPLQWPWLLLDSLLKWCMHEVSKLHLLHMNEAILLLITISPDKHFTISKLFCWMMSFVEVIVACVWRYCGSS